MILLDIQSPTQEGVVLQGINRGPTNQNAIKENGQLAFPGAMTFVDILNQVARRLENLVYDEAQGKDYRKLPWHMPHLKCQRKI